MSSFTAIVSGYQLAVKHANALVTNG